MAVRLNWISNNSNMQVTAAFLYKYNDIMFIDKVGSTLH